MKPPHLRPLFPLALLIVVCGCEEHLLVGIGGGPPAVGTGGGPSAVGTGGRSSVGEPDPRTSKLTGPQPGMVGVTAPNGTSYYVDRTEVTQAAYAQFLADEPRPNRASATCGWKTTFAPGMEVDATYLSLLDPVTDQPATECRPENTLFDPIGHGDYPVVCVDWCDAEAYCLWAGKRLCGRIGGGSVEDPNDGSQWRYACSNGGTTPFPYGSSYIEGQCNDFGGTVAVGSTPGCHGIAPPYDGIVDMSGNVQEWEDQCTINPFDLDGGTRSGEECTLRGGAFFKYNPPPADLDTAASFLCGSAVLDGTNFSADLFGARNLEDEAVGFRCCVD